MTGPDVFANGALVQLADPSRLADTSLSFAERLHDNPNAIDEYIGPTSLKIVIHFAPPASLGLDEGALKRSGFKTSASGTARVADAPDTTFMFMLHPARDTPAGMELLSRYWIGAHPEFIRFRVAGIPRRFWPGWAWMATPLSGWPMKWPCTI